MIGHLPYKDRQYFLSIQIINIIIKIREYNKGICELMNCSKCGSQITDDGPTCPNCGAELEQSQQNDIASEEHLCSTCGDELEYITTYKQWYCYNCQEYVDLPPPSPSSPSPSPSPEEEPEPDLEIQGIDTDPELEQVEDGGSDVEVSTNEIAEDELSWDEVGVTETEPDIEFTFEVDSEPTEVQEEGIDLEEISGEEMEITEPDSGIELDPSSITDLSANEVESVVEFDDSELAFASEEQEPIIELGETPREIKNKIGLEKEAIVKLHQAWVKVNNLKELRPDETRVLELGEELRKTMKGESDPKDAISLADHCMEVVDELEKELRDNIHHEISNKFHFVNSKILLAKNIGFDVDNIEEDLDSVTSMIARSMYHSAHKELEKLLQQIYNLPDTQDEILIGMDTDSEQLKELLRPPDEEDKPIMED